MKTVRPPGVDPRLPDRRYVRSLFDWLAPNYDRAVLTYSFAQDLRWKSVLVRHLDPRRGEKALDLACGTGLISDRLARELGPEAVVGLDLNRAMLAASARVGRELQRVRADSVRLPFRDASFDIVSAGYLLKYVPLGLLAGEVRRVLRPGGRFGGYDFSAPLAHTIAGRIYERILGQVLPWLARHLGRDDQGWSELLCFLGLVARTSGWEHQIVSELERAGFVGVERLPSLGGTVTWVWGQVPGPSSNSTRSGEEEERRGGIAPRAN